MKYLFFDSFGEIKFCYDGHNISGQVLINPGLDFIVVDAQFNIKNHWINDVANPAPVLLPPQPSREHVFNYSLRDWVLTEDGLNRLKTLVVSNIMAYADALHNAPILYDSKLLDADAVARENISGKVNQLKAEIDLSISSANLFWKDADNVVHSWSSAAVYLEWLQGLLIAIASRRTDLYAATWLAKADIYAMTDIADVLAFDVAAAFV